VVSETGNGNRFRDVQIPVTVSIGALLNNVVCNYLVICVKFFVQLENVIRAASGVLERQLN